MEWAYFWHVDKNSGNLKTFFNNFCIVLVGNGGDHLGFETPKSAVSQEWIYEMS